jgi:hypothetical protein
MLFAAASLVGLIMLGAGYWLLHQPERSPEFPPSPQYLLQVRRGNNLLSLKSALPLRTGDEFDVRCDLPRGFHPALFTFDAKGQLEHYPDIEVASAGRFDCLSFLATLAGPAGTEFLLVCASAKLIPAPEKVQPLFASEAPWPPLPDHVVVWMDREQVRVEGTRSLERRASRDAVDTIETRLQELRRQLLRDRFEFFIGVAYAHRE